MDVDQYVETLPSRVQCMQQAGGDPIGADAVTVRPRRLFDHLPKTRWCFSVGVLDTIDVDSATLDLDEWETLPTIGFPGDATCSSIRRYWGCGSRNMSRERCNAIFLLSFCAVSLGVR